MKRYSVERNSTQPWQGVCVLRFLEARTPESGLSGLAECHDCGSTFFLHCPAPHEGPCGSDCSRHHLLEMDRIGQSHPCVPQEIVTG